MYAVTKQRRLNVEIELEREDFEIKERSENEYGDRIKAVLEGVLKKRITHWGYEPAKVLMTDADGKPSWGKVVAYYWWDERLVD